MSALPAVEPQCSIHGYASKRQTCRECNAAYMRAYMRARRLEKPAKLLIERARSRAKRKNLPCWLTTGDIVIPERCPALGIPLALADKRSAGSPSLDRIIPKLGYVSGNVRVISDRANRLKSDHCLEALQELAQTGPVALRAEYAAIATYVERACLLSNAKARAEESRRAGDEWDKIALFLEQLLVPIRN